MLNFNTGIKVLVVDDFPTMRRIVRNLLRQIGFESIEEAEDGLQALNKVKNGNFGLILCDWNMPQMEGSALKWNAALWSSKPNPKKFLRKTSTIF